jgi:ABC-type sugar transport system ATPase subunit
MVGRTVEVRPLPPRTIGAPLFEVDGVRTAAGAGPVSFTIRAGEVVTIAGMVGSGRTELARAIYGAEPISSGVIRINGSEVTHRHPRHAIDSRVALLTEDRKDQGLAMNLSIAENVTLMDPPRSLGVLRRREQRSESVEVCASVGLHRDPTVQVSMLSGGNQQKVLLARWVRSKSLVYILDEPTRGVDIGAKEEIYKLLQRLAENGAAVLVISSELPEVLALGDRVLVMRGGRVIAEHSRQDASEEGIIRDAARSDHAVSR